MPSPQTFWPAYRESLRRIGSWELYQSNTQWTEIAKRAAEMACESLGMKYSREYFRIDVIGYTEIGQYDWDLRIAFEAENAPNWKDEFCKLTHVVADLKVIATFEAHKGHDAIESLRDYLPSMRARMQRVANAQWLFIFGPRWQNPTDRWTAWTLDDDLAPVAIDDDRPLIGREMGL